MGFKWLRTKWERQSELILRTAFIRSVDKKKRAEISLTKITKGKNQGSKSIAKSLIIRIYLFFMDVVEVYIIRMVNNM